VRLLDGHLGELVLDLADHAARAKDPDLAVSASIRTWISRHRDAPVRGLDAVLDRSDQLLARDLLFGIDWRRAPTKSRLTMTSFVVRFHRRRSKETWRVTHVAERPFSCPKYTPGSVDGST